MSARALLLRALIAPALLAPALRADESAGLQAAREARQSLLAGEPARALELLDKARIELPGSDVVACTRGDALLALGRAAEAQSEYERALSGPQAHHARFNRGVARNAQGEAALQEAGVPASVAALPEGSQPQMLQALGAARPQLERARDDFLAALDLDDEPQARESVGALNRRLDALAAIEEELLRRQQDEEKKDEGKEKPDDQKPKDQEGDKPADPQDGQEKQDQPPQDQPKDEQQQQKQEGEQPPEDGQDKEQPKPEPQDGGQGEQQGTEGPQPPAPVARALSKEEAERLLDTLERLEAAARERQKAAQSAARRQAEKDW